MDLLIAQIAAGIATGSLYFLVASGLTLVWGSLGVVNLAHGSFYMIAAFLTVALVEAFGPNYGLLASVFAVPAAIAALAFFLEMGLFRKIYNAGIWGQLLLTFGLVLLLNDFVRTISGPLPRSVLPPNILRGAFELFDVRVAKYQVAIVGATILVAIYLWYLLTQTRTGRLIRAAVDDPQMLSATGVNVTHLRTEVMVIAASLAAIAGVIATPRGAVNTSMDVQIVIIAFAIIVIGGLGSIWGALAGAILVGVAESVSTIFIDKGGEMVIFLIMIAVLIFRPTGFKTIAGRD